MLIWLSLGFLIVVTIAALGFALRRGLQFWRDFKQLNRALGDGLDSIAQRTAEIELHLQAASHSGSALEQALGRLSRSRARLAVLTAALADVRAALGRITAVMPRK